MIKFPATGAAGARASQSQPTSKPELLKLELAERLVPELKLAERQVPEPEWPERK